MNLELIRRLETEWPDTKMCNEAASTIKTQAKRIAELEAALRLFADGDVHIGDFDVAKRLLSS